MKNKLTDLNDHLFMQLERLSDESLKGEGLEEEVQRAKSITGVSKEIIGNAKLVLEAQKAMNEGYLTGKTVPSMLTAGK